MGLAVGFPVGAVGAAAIVVAAVIDSPVPLFGALFVYGAGLLALLLVPALLWRRRGLAAPGRR